MADNTILNAGSGGDVIASDDIAGVKYQRVKACYGADGSAADVSPTSPLPTFDRHDGRTMIQLYATAVAAGTTGTETAISLAKALCDGSAPAAGAASITITNGKRFRITSITLAARGNATATAQVTKFTLRCNSAGAVTTASNAAMVAQVATPATALAYDRVSLPLEDAGLEFVGNGTLSIGITANAVFTTNAPTWDVLITGYEFS